MHLFHFIFRYVISWFRYQIWKKLSRSWIWSQKIGNFHSYHKWKRMIQRKQIYKLLVYLTLFFSLFLFILNFKPFSPKSFYTTIQGIVLILSVHMLWKAITFFCQFNSVQSEKDMDFKMAITITNSPFKFENS